MPAASSLTVLVAVALLLLCAGCTLGLALSLSGQKRKRQRQSRAAPYVDLRYLYWFTRTGEAISGGARCRAARFGSSESRTLGAGGGGQDEAGAGMERLRWVHWCSAPVKLLLNCTSALRSSSLQQLHHSAPVSLIPDARRARARNGERASARTTSKRSHQCSLPGGVVSLMGSLELFLPSGKLIREGEEREGEAAQRAT